jgi:hypothetical protein
MDFYDLLFLYITPGSTKVQLRLQFESTLYLSIAHCDKIRQTLGTVLV